MEGDFYMFKKNDKALLTVKGLFTALCIVIAAVFIILGLSVMERDANTGVKFILIGVLAVPIIYIIILVKLNFYCDVKLIRNKLYGLNNNDLEIFLDEIRNENNVKKD